jgi:hypothetical protein
MNKKKKIGCVLAYCDNYGSMLQSFATLKTISSLGYDCEVIRYVKKESILQKLKKVYWMIRIGDCTDQLRELKRKINVYIHPEYKKMLIIKKNAFAQFGDKYLKPYFKEFVGYEVLQKASFLYDLVLVGSDQLWTPMSLYSNYYNLMFVGDNIPKVAYAASFGVSKLPSFQYKATKRYLDRFNMIGVREDSGKKIVDSLSINKATHVADPSLLLTREQWENVASDYSILQNEPYILCLFLGKNMEARNAVNELRIRTGMKVVAICHNDEYISADNSLGDVMPHDISPADFINLVKEATYVCTDSFHCTIFSILFHKKFMTFYRYAASKKGGRNSRIDSILQFLNIQNRIYTDDVLEIERDIDYESVDRIVTGFRDMSLEFLKKELSLADKITQ